MLSWDSRFGAMGRAPWAICSWVRRAARDCEVAELMLSNDSEGLISAASIEGKAWGMGKNGVDGGAEVEKGEVLVKDMGIVGSRSGYAENKGS